MTVAEGAWIVSARATKQGLQWGRNLTVAEGQMPLRAQRAAWRFNGAAT